jgi:hypothetical protein
MKKSCHSGSDPKRPIGFRTEAYLPFFQPSEDFQWKSNALRVIKEPQATDRRWERALQDQSGSARKKSRWAFFAMAIVYGTPVGADTSLEVDRACKPVVPQVIVKLLNQSELRAGYQLFVSYDEAGSAPFSKETFSRGGIRHSGCEIKDGRCISSRMRYETRLEGLRQQSIQLRKMGGWVTGSESNLLGGVLWYGPSYPDRVNITCDLSDSDARTACILDSVEYTPNPATSGDDGLKPQVRRHDQCQPKSSKPSPV